MFIMKQGIQHKQERIQPINKTNQSLPQLVLLLSFLQDKQSLNYYLLVL